MTKVFRTSTPHLIAVVAALSAAMNIEMSYGQSDDLIAVSAETTNTTADSSIYGDKFKEAERALLEGLSSDDAASIQQVSVAPVAPKAKPPIERASADSAQTTTSVEPAVPAAKLIQPAKAPPVKMPQVERKPSNQGGAVAILQGKLTTSELKVRELEQQLSEAKSQLSAAEVEINRLSSIVSGGSRARLATRTMESGATQSALSKGSELASSSQRAVNPLVQEPQRIVADVAPPAPTQNLQVATVAVEKAELRLGPGKNHSALMTIPRGSRLAVEVRQGEWYRVFAPSGERAWIHSSLVRFGEGAASMNDGSSVKVRGYELDAEQQAFRRAGSLTGSK